MESGYITKFDAKKLWLCTRHEENLLRKKRRWLMGLRISKSRASMKLKTPKFLKDVSLPESFLREDDVSSEAVRTYVERSFGALIGGQEKYYVTHNYLQLFDMKRVNHNTVPQSNILGTISSALDDLNNNGLFRLAIIATGNSIKFEETRSRMKDLIRKHLPNTLRKSNHRDCKDALVQLFTDPSNFRENQLSIGTRVPESRVPESLVSAARKVLERLGDMCTYTQRAMLNKLEGIVACPQMKRCPHRLNRKRLIKQIQKVCYQLLSQLREGDELPRQLAKAMAVAGLYLKQRSGLVDFPIPDFYNFPPEIEALQNQILKAIQSLEKFCKVKLKVLEPILDPKAEISRRAFRTSTRRLLSEYLYECGDMEIPESLLIAIAFINDNSADQLRISRESMEEELECVLDVSSQLRQIIWQMLPDDNIDQEFADVYMDDLESDDDKGSDDVKLDDDGKYSDFEYLNVPFIGDACFGQSDRLQIHASHSDDECVGESRPTVSTLPLSATNGSGSPQFAVAYANFCGNSIEAPKSELIASPHSRDRHGIGSQSCLKDLMWSQNAPHKAQNKCENQYLAMQDICDETSLVAHRLIGRLLKEFLQIEGIDLDTSMILYLRDGASIPADFRGAGELKTNSTEDIGGLVLIRAVEELVPSFPKRRKKFLGS